MSLSSERSDAAAHAAYRDRRRFGNLDGLRFICIFMVLWHHFTPFPYLEQWMGFRRGFLGVDFFFVLSGFLITTLLLREASQTGRISLRNFYLRRILRIVPVYFFVVTCVSAYYILVKGRTELLELATTDDSYRRTVAQDGSGKSPGSPSPSTTRLS